MQEDLFMKTIKTVLKAFLLYFLAIHCVDGNLKSLSLDPTYRCNATAKAGYKAERYY